MEPSKLQSTMIVTGLAPGYPEEPDSRGGLRAFRRSGSSCWESTSMIVSTSQDGCKD